MKFVATEDIRAPIDHVWATVTDFDRFEGMLSKRSQSLDRQPKGPVAVGTRWTGRAVISGKKRDISAVLATLDPGSRMVVEGGTDGMQVTVDTVIEAKGPDLTRLTVVTEAKARTLAARLLLQSAKLARGTLAKRYKARVGAFAERVEGALAR